MPLASSRLNLTASSFPLISKNYGASVLARARTDVDYVITNQYSGSQADAFIGIPTFLYMHNCMPYTHGIRSVGYKVAAGGFGKSTEFDNAYTLIYGAEDTVVFVPAKGKNYINRGGTWSSAAAPFRMAGTVTTAYLKQKSYVAYQGNGIFVLNTATGQMLQVTLQGLNTASLLGIVAANSYLLAYDEDTIYFSDPTDELNFQPTLASGAGSESVLPLKGKIITCLPIENGFIIYSSKNAVSAQYTGDDRFPWVYREIDGSSGVTTPEHVAWASNYSGHYAWTLAGLQFLAVDKATNVYPEVSDFLAGNEIEEYVGDLGVYPGNAAPDSAAGLFGEFQTCEIGNNQLITQALPAGINSMMVKLSLVASRYLCISYGALQLEYVLVYDLSLQRWGKLKQVHAAVFEYPLQKGTAGQPGSRIALLAKNGKISVVEADTYEGVDKSDTVLILGRIEASRGRSSNIQKLTASTLRESAVTILPSLNGMDWIPEVVPMPVDVGPTQTVFALDTYCKASSIKVTGDFDLNSLVVEINIARS